MDQKKFISIGIIKVLWNYDIIDEIKDAYFEFYIPEKIDYNYGNMYCNRFVFLNNNIAINVETVESKNFNFEKLDFDKKNNLFKIKFKNNILFLNEEQLNLLEDKLSNFNIIKKNQKFMNYRIDTMLFDLCISFSCPTFYITNFCFFELVYLILNNILLAPNKEEIID